MGLGRFFDAMSRVSVSVGSMALCSEIVSCQRIACENHSETRNL